MSEDQQPPVEYLRSLLELLPDGVLIWKTGRKLAGTQAGTLDKKGYRRVKIKNKAMCAHRIVWALLTGAWPSGEIDHINGIRSDNRPENLRDVPRTLNQRNRPRNKNNRSGVNGVSWHKATGKWGAFIYGENKKQQHLGIFPTVAEASAARAAAEHGRGFTERHGQPV